MYHNDYQLDNDLNHNEGLFFLLIIILSIRSIHCGSVFLSILDKMIFQTLTHYLQMAIIFLPPLSFVSMKETGFPDKSNLCWAISFLLFRIMNLKLPSNCAFQ